VSDAPVGTERVGDIAVLSIDHPPVNALSHAVRLAVLEAVTAADLERSVAAIVVRGVGKHFVAGADIHEFDAAPLEPVLNEVLLRVEACGKPVIAALHGSALGGGFELALACHYRIAAEDASLGLPEIRLGLLPGAGGTQRLPRLIGAREALALMLSGDPIPCARALELGAVDRISRSPDYLAEAIEYAREIAASGAGPRRLRDRAARGSLDSGFVAEQRALATRKYPGVESREAIIECIEASATEGFDAALALSRRRFEQCRQSNSSRALRHLFFAERGARPAGAVRPVAQVGVLGAGTMGSGIAVSLATAGVGVTLADTNPGALASGLERVRTTIGAAADKGRLERSAADAAIGRVRGSATVDALVEADLVIEAIFESLAVKQEAFASLGRICRPGAILASNTSTLDIDAIAQASGRAQDVVGMHFFSPANIMRLVEIVRGASTAPDVIATAQSLSRRMGKLGIVVGNCFGFVGNRMLYAYGRENQLMMLEGATPSQIDAALESFGMAMGPNAVGDLAGLDVGYRVRRERKDLRDDPRYYRVADLLVEAGRLGQKSGKGAYAYAPGSRRPAADVEVEAMIAAESQRLRVARRTIGDEEIQERCLFALINEGARILAEGIANSPADIDAIWCNGYGFPRFRGGPLFYADTIGPAALLAGIRRFGQLHGARDWTPAPLLIEIAGRGDTFGAWGKRRASTTG
jgi:3-hydroxyacyl-CoA dehydrogenase